MSPADAAFIAELLARFDRLEERLAAHERLLLDALDEAGVPHPPRPQFRLIPGGRQ